MKRNLLIASMMMVAGTTVFAQSSTHTFTPVALSATARPTAASRTTTCTADTLRYAVVKEYALNPTPAFNALPINPNEEQSQGFLSPGTVNVVGVDFRGRVNSANSAATVPVKVYLYSVDAAYMPVARLDSATLNVVTTTVKYYHVNFATPHTITGNYAVAVKAAGTFKFDVISNDRDVAAGGEALSYNRWNPGTGLTWYANADATNGWGQDFDADINPIVTYTLSADYTASASTICQGTAITFTNTTTPSTLLLSRMYNYNAFVAYFGGVTDSTYAWDMGNTTPLLWTSAPTYTYPAAGTYTATLYALAGFWNSCMDTKATTITVNATPALMITNPAPACTPSTVDLTAASVTAGSTGGGTLTYWNDAAASSSMSSPSAVSAGSTYYIQADNAGCTDLQPVTVTINTTPSLLLTSPAAVCAPSTIDLTAAAVTSGSTGGGTLSYWNDAGATSALSSPSMVASSGVYYIQADNAGCTDIDMITVTVNPLDDATISGPSSMICTTDPAFNLTAVTSGGTWTGTGIVNNFNGTFDPGTAGAGTFTVSYTTAGTCPATGTTNVTVSVCMGVQTISGVAAVNIYPNPSNGIVNIDLGVSEKSLVTVYNVIGAEVIAKEFNTQISSFDMSSYEAGVYFVKVATASGQITKQITITK